MAGSHQTDNLNVQTNTDRTYWWDRAKCRGGDMSQYWPHGNEGKTGFLCRVDPAKVCEGCPVMAQCGLDALLKRDQGVVRGGKYIDDFNSRSFRYLLQPDCMDILREVEYLATDEERDILVKWYRQALGKFRDVDIDRENIWESVHELAMEVFIESFWAGNEQAYRDRIRRIKEVRESMLDMQVSLKEGEDSRTKPLRKRGRTELNLDDEPKQTKVKVKKRAKSKAKPVKVPDAESCSALFDLLDEVVDSLNEGIKPDVALR